MLCGGMVEHGAHEHVALVFSCFMHRKENLRNTIALKDLEKASTLPKFCWRLT